MSIFGFTVVVGGPVEVTLKIMDFLNGLFDYAAITCRHGVTSFVTSSTSRCKHTVSNLTVRCLASQVASNRRACLRAKHSLRFLSKSLT